MELRVPFRTLPAGVQTFMTRTSEPKVSHCGSSSTSTKLPWVVNFVKEHRFVLVPAYRTWWCPAL